MNNRKKSTALYPHPFFKAYWKDAFAEMKDTRMLVFAALMIALRVAMKFLAIPLAPNLKIQTAFVANAMGAMVFGPVVAVFAAIVSDFLGVMLSGDTYFLPFVLTEIAGSVIFALFLYRAKVTPVRAMLSRFCICLFVNILLQTPLMMLYYRIVLGKSGYLLTVPHILKNLFCFPVESVILTLFLKMVQPATYRMGLTYDSEVRLHFDKKQSVTLAALFLVGCVSTYAYLGYYYRTTSLSASYSAEERYDANCSMGRILENSLDEERPLVATVESAYKEFMGKNTTYNVAVYAVDEEALAAYDKDLETIRGMSKSKAKAVAEDGVMEQIGTATIALNNKTGEVVAAGFQEIGD
ncbi:MAG: folate family ECF transporter S component [Oscillospiraceae bacterium]|nr:folate family ECF transporter S component [Oscillospiraceae bacterium]